MTDDAKVIAHRAQVTRRAAFQAWLDTLLTPASQVPAQITRANWEPIRQYLQEGPDNGQREEPENPQRI